MVECDAREVLAQQGEQMRRVAMGCGETERHLGGWTPVVREYPVQALRTRVASAQKSRQFQQQASRGKQQGLDDGGPRRHLPPAFETRGRDIRLARVAAPALDT